MSCGPRPRALALALGVLVAAIGVVSNGAGTSASATAAPTSAGLCIPRSTPIHVGLQLVSSKPVDARVSDLSLRSTAMDGIVHVDVMVPAGFNPTSSRRYPVLYLFHGSDGSYRDWVDHGVEALVGNVPLIVVMPDGGYDGAYSDWYGQTALLGPSTPAPAWQTFDIDELIPWIDAHYPTIATRAGRAVAGLSAGGGGAVKYAAEYPQLFAAAGSFSGAVDNELDSPSYPLIAEVLATSTLTPGDGPPVYCVWGDPFTEAVIWYQSDPTYLAPNLGGVSLFLASGNGLPGPADVPALANPADLDDEAAAAATELEVGQMNQALVAALNSAHIAHSDDFYGNGTHSWPYWIADFRRFLPWLMDHLGTAPTPASFSYRSSLPSFSAWGWDFVALRRVTEFMYLTDVSAHGLSVTGSGTLVVTTAPLYRPHQSYDVTDNGVPSAVIADAGGRLHFTIGLGPSHGSQQSDFGPSATAGWRHATVSIG